MGGLSAGYNWQYDHLVAGLEADLGYLGAEDRQADAFAFTKAEYGGYGTVTGRLGYADDRWLFYGKGGLAFADIKNTAGAITLAPSIRSTTPTGRTYGPAGLSAPVSNMHSSATFR